MILQVNRMLGLHEGYSDLFLASHIVPQPPAVVISECKARRKNPENYQVFPRKQTNKHKPSKTNEKAFPNGKMPFSRYVKFYVTQKELRCIGGS